MRQAGSCLPLASGFTYHIMDLHACSAPWGAFRRARLSKVSASCAMAGAVQSFSRVGAARRRLCEVAVTAGAGDMLTERKRVSLGSVGALGLQGRKNAPGRMLLAP
jgi:hypothetical protein